MSSRSTSEQSLFIARKLYREVETSRAENTPVKLSTIETIIFNNSFDSFNSQELLCNPSNIIVKFCTVRISPRLIASPATTVIVESMRETPSVFSFKLCKLYRTNVILLKLHRAGESSSILSAIAGR